MCGKNTTKEWDTQAKAKFFCKKVCWAKIIVYFCTVFKN